MDRLALTLAALALTAPAAAQDGSEAAGPRTPENAQKFLEVAAGRFGLFMEGKGMLTTGQFDVDKLRYGKLEITAASKCQTRFDGTISEFWLKEGGTVVSSGRETSAAVINGLAKQYGRTWLKTAPYIIDWSTVTKVAVGSNFDPKKGEIEVPETAVVRSPTQSITLISASEEIAGRLRLAMETLRLACDSTKELGF